MTYSPLAAPGATIRVLKAHGLYTDKALGQHFLVDDNVVGRILSLAAVTDSQTVLEIGPGIGTLTAALCERAGAVIAVERDRRLEPVLADTLGGCERFHVLYADALELAPDDLKVPFGLPDVCVANLPYAVAATLVLRLFERFTSVRSATVMVQAEVADRMCALPGPKEYGAYSVKLQLRARLAGRFAVARTCFLPPPRVDSAVVRFERADAGESSLVLAAGALADVAFAQRRKTLRNTLKAGLHGGACDAERLLASAGIDGARRAETLSVEEYLEMARTALELGLLP